MNRFKKTRARAPLRLGLAGGGTDLSPYCDMFGGAILLCSCSSAWSGAPSSNRSETPMYDRMIRDFHGGTPLPLTIKTTVDAPAGSGLGSSSALVVALVDGFRAMVC